MGVEPPVLVEDGYTYTAAAFERLIEEVPYSEKFPSPWTRKLIKRRPPTVRCTTFNWLKDDPQPYVARHDGGRQRRPPTVRCTTFFKSLRKSYSGSDWRLYGLLFGILPHTLLPTGKTSSPSSPFPPNRHNSTKLSLSTTIPCTQTQLMTNLRCTQLNSL